MVVRPIPLRRSRCDDRCASAAMRGNVGREGESWGLLAASRYQRGCRGDLARSSRRGRALTTRRDTRPLNGLFREADDACEKPAHPPMERGLNLGGRAGVVAGRSDPATERGGEIAKYLPSLVIKCSAANIDRQYNPRYNKLAFIVELAIAAFSSSILLAQPYVTRRLARERTLLNAVDVSRSEIT